MVSAALFVAISIATILATSLVAGLLLTFFSPDAAGSGIPQLKVAFWRDFGYLPLKIVFTKFFAGAIIRDSLHSDLSSYAERPAGIDGGWDERLSGSGRSRADYVDFDCFRNDPSIRVCPVADDRDDREPGKEMLS